MKKILITILLILTIILMYTIIFPKKSYVETLLEKELAPEIEENFNKNINTLKIASNEYFKENEKEKVTLQELIDKNIITELKDTANSTCDNNSYVEKKDNITTIYLKCKDKEDTIKIEEQKEKNKTKNEEKNKMFCLYEYKKEIEETTPFSDWSTNEIKEEKNIIVETKQEKIKDGTTLETRTREIEKEAYEEKKLGCPDEEENGKCIIKTETNSITASVGYTCPEGYTKKGTMCYGENNVPATKYYYCPSSISNLKFELDGNMCKTYNIRYTNPTSNNTYYYCDEGYELSGNMCYKTEYYEEEVETYKDVTYYRYAKKEKKYDIIWSRKDNNDLKDKSYNITKEITCDF